MMIAANSMHNEPLYSNYMNIKYPFNAQQKIIDETALWWKMEENQKIRHVVRTRGALLVPRQSINNTRIVRPPTFLSVIKIRIIFFSLLFGWIIFVVVISVEYSNLERMRQDDYTETAQE